MERTLSPIPVNSSDYRRDSNIYRRIQHRLTVKESAAVLMQEGIEKPVTLRNISGSGACILIDALPEITKTVKLIINHSPFLVQPFRGDATVVWRDLKKGNIVHLGLHFKYDQLELSPLLPASTSDEETTQKITTPKNILTIASLFVAAVILSVIFLSVISR